MKSIGKVFHLVLTALFLAILISIPLQARAADVEFNLSWSAPITGGPVDSYAATCTDAAGTTVLDAATTDTTAAGNATDVAEGAGTCSVVAIGPGGTGEPAVAAFSIGVTLPPGAPQDVTITLQCTVADGVAVCEQV